MQVYVDERKWPDRMHWQFAATRLGEDEHGVWLWAPQGAVAQRGLENPIELAHGFVMLVPRAEWWLVEFYEDHPVREIYTNIGTPPVWDGDRFTHIDLDLDVVRNVDGSVEVLDEDEFLDHQVRYRYPEDLIASARTAACRVAQLLHLGTEPFGSAAARWLEMAGVDIG